MEKKKENKEKLNKEDLKKVQGGLPIGKPKEPGAKIGSVDENEDDKTVEPKKAMPRW